MEIDRKLAGTFLGALSVLLLIVVAIYGVRLDNTQEQVEACRIALGTATDELVQLTDFLRSEDWAVKHGEVIRGATTKIGVQLIAPPEGFEEQQEECFEGM